MRLPWLTKRSLEDNTRRSAGIISPADSWMMSPCTRLRNGISLALPSRMTVAVTWIMALSLVAAASARASCKKPESDTQDYHHGHDCTGPRVTTNEGNSR